MIRSRNASKPPPAPQPTKVEEPVVVVEVKEEIPLSVDLPKFTHAPLEKVLRFSSEIKEDIDKLDELYNNGTRKFRKYKVSNHDPEIAIELALCRILYQEKWKELMKKHIPTSTYWLLFTEFAHE